MSIAEKLTTIAENAQKVYDAGKQAERDRFWDIVQNYGKRTSYNYAFRGLTWTDDVFFPKYDFIQVGQATSMFYGCQITNLKQRLIDCGVKLDLSKANTVGELFAQSTITHIPEISFNGVTYQNLIGNSFSGAKSLHTIDKLTVNETQKFSNTFANCEALEKLIMDGTIGQNGFDVHWSTKLTHDSLMSILNALQDKSSDTSGTNWVVTIGTENQYKLTDSEKAIATQKGWSLA